MTAPLFASISKDMGRKGGIGEVGGGKNLHRETESHLQLANWGTTSARAIKSAFFPSHLNLILPPKPTIPLLLSARTNHRPQTIFPILSRATPSCPASRRGIRKRANIRDLSHCSVESLTCLRGSKICFVAELRCSSSLSRKKIGKLILAVETLIVSERTKN